MSLIDRYVLKEWATGFALTMGVILGILILQNMYDSLPDLLDASAGFQQILLYYALALPGYLPTVLPITFLVSLLFSMGTLHRNNEVTAMRATGASLFRITRSLWVAGLALSACMFYLTADVVPYTVERDRTFLDNLEFSAKELERDAKEIGLRYNLGFDNRKDDRLWFMNRFSERAWLAMGINVHSRTKEGVEVHRVSAEEAYFDEGAGHWVFLNGRELIIDPDTGDELRLMAFEEKAFPEYTEDPGIMLAMHKKANTLSLFELREIIDTVPPEENPAVMKYTTRYYHLLAAPFSCFVVVGIAVPFAVSGVRANPMLGISKCLAYFAGFYALMSIAAVLGERHLIPALFAAWLPNIAMLGIALWLYKRAR